MRIEKPDTWPSSMEGDSECRTLPNHPPPPLAELCGTTWKRDWHRNLCATGIGTNSHHCHAIGCQQSLATRILTSSVFHYFQQKVWDKEGEIILILIWFVYDSIFWGGRQFSFTWDEYILAQYQLESHLFNISCIWYCNAFSPNTWPSLLLTLYWLLRTLYWLLLTLYWLSIDFY